MKQLNYISKLLAFLLIIGFAMTSCQKDSLEAIESFDIEGHLGRYVFDIDFETYHDGVTVKESYSSVGYIRKVNDNTIKLLFDFSVPKVNCTYEYIVKADGSLYSTNKGAGERKGELVDGGIHFTEVITLKNGNFKQLDFSGYISNLDKGS